MKLAEMYIPLLKTHTSSNDYSAIQWIESGNRWKKAVFVSFQIF
jgi:hypothetical protein